MNCVRTPVLQQQNTVIKFHPKLLTSKIQSNEAARQLRKEDLEGQRDAANFSAQAGTGVTAFCWY